MTLSHSRMRWDLFDMRIQSANLRIILKNNWCWYCQELPNISKNINKQTNERTNKQTGSPSRDDRYIILYDLIFVDTTVGHFQGSREPFVNPMLCLSSLSFWGRYSGSVQGEPVVDHRRLTVWDGSLSLPLGDVRIHSWDLEHGSMEPIAVQLVEFVKRWCSVDSHWV